MNNKFVQASMITDRSKQEPKRLSSREVAPMMEIRHDSLLRKIDGINKDFTDHNIVVSKYWIENNSPDNSGKLSREFQISKRGCEFLAHKTTGTKGNLFTDKYMDRFEEMENVIQNSLPIGLETMQGMAFLSENMAGIGQHVQVLTQFTMGLKEYVQDSIQAKDKQIDDMANLVGIRTKNKCDLIQITKNTLVRKYNLSRINSSMEVYKRAKDKVFKEFNVTKWEDIPATKYNSVQAFIEECL
ncbi:Rha family transcriptional regulator [Clostridium butyricum]|uniref:Rha family transcriptional regulator n=1 Tax=Clostridium butyricum TaxID=1492 RepID=UPI0018A06D11|nr:Rha family transcriptional regulator [Clostridium butyricum]MDB2150567.1 Rha family transcriptional regulator [Clostridium butyricum]